MLAQMIATSVKIPKKQALAMLKQGRAEMKTVGNGRRYPGVRVFRARIEIEVLLKLKK